MAQILIVYASDWGSTKKMADVVAKGVVSVAGSKALVKPMEEVVAEDLTAADGVIVGSYSMSPRCSPDAGARPGSERTRAPKSFQR